MSYWNYKNMSDEQWKAYVKFEFFLKRLLGAQQNKQHWGWPYER